MLIQNKFNLCYIIVSAGLNVTLSPTQSLVAIGQPGALSSRCTLGPGKGWTARILYIQSYPAFLQEVISQLDPVNFWSLDGNIINPFENHSSNIFSCQQTVSCRNKSYHYKHIDFKRLFYHSTSKFRKFLDQVKTWSTKRN